MTAQVYPSIEDVMNLARVYVDDTLAAGAGITLTDAAPETLPLLNASIAQMQRDLWNRSVPTMIRETVLTGLPPINSALGVGAPNPAVYQALTYTGFNDGSVVHTGIVLPPDLLAPIKVWFRAGGTNLTFSEMNEAANGLASFYQGPSPGDWEWQGDQIALNGATQAIDMRLRYLGTVAYYPSTTLPANFPTTYLPFRDSVQALAYRLAYDFCAARVQSGGANDLLANYQSSIDGMVQRQVRRMQHVVYERQPYGSSAIP